MMTSKKIVGGLALAVASVTALAACSSSSSGGHSSSGSSSSSSIGLAGQFGSVPAESTGKEYSGDITIASPPNSTASWILPIIQAADVSVFDVTEFDYQMWRPMYWEFKGTQPEETPSMSLADDPVYSNGDKTLTITMKSNYKWSDGQPITAQDFLFTYYEIKAATKESPANDAYYTPGLGFPDDVKSISAPNSSTVVINLTGAVNPTWYTEDELGSVAPMPAHAWAKASANGPTLNYTVPANAKAIYDYLDAQSKSLATYASNPLWQVVDGPYKLTAYNTTTGQFSMAPNTGYSGPHASVESDITVEPFTSDSAELNAVKSGKVDVGYIPANNVPEASSLASSYNEYGYPDFGYDAVVYNFQDTTGDFSNIINQLYMRQALAHLEDEQGYIHAFFYGAGGQAYGPIPTIPSSPFAPSNALTDPYPFSTADAASILKDNGWSVVPNGTDTCTKPGTGAGECGAGIPSGTKLEWNVVYGTSPGVLGEQVQDWASEARQVGITMNLSTSNFDYMIANDNDVAQPKDADKWAMEDFGGFTNSTYPTTFSVFNIGGGENTGGYDSKQATALIEASLSSSNPDAVTAEAQYLTQQQPSLFQPLVDNVFGTAGLVVWSKDLSGNPDSYATLTQPAWNPEYWFFTKS
jgi:peptide/nickel transport system substrate-binding protein